MSSKKLTIYKVKVPLKQPYFLSFGVVEEYTSIIVLYSDGKNNYFGEVTALPGYSWETSESIWNTLKNWLLLSENSLNKIISIVQKERRKYPFAATSILTAIEKQTIFEEKSFTSLRIPIVGTISIDDLKEFEMQAASLLTEGYKTIKIKAKGDPKNDIQKVKLLQSLVDERIKIRIDANQSYSFEKIKRFMDRVDPSKIELFEQPFKPDAWDEMKKLSKISPVPLMLDESIWTKEDIEKVIEFKCADYIKLKLVKISSINDTINLCNFARRYGLNVVLGNGVQTEIGCIDEAIIYKKSNLETTAEMNGFLKQSIHLLTNPIEYKNGEIIIKEKPVVNLKTLEDCLIDKMEFSLCR